MPGLKVLLMSGYTENAIRHQNALRAGANLIRKPFTKAELDSQIRDALTG